MSARSSAYPKQLKVDFRKLELSKLQAYMKHYNIHVAAEAPQEDLATAVAKHFELQAKGLESSTEHGILHHFLSSYDQAFGKALNYSEPPAAKRPKYSPAVMHDRAGMSYGPAQEGEIVAAKVKDLGLEAESGWILATVRRYHLELDEYEVVDEDDVASEGEQCQVYRLGRDRITRLDDGLGGLNKGDAVMAVFPDTTSFYRGHISKPVRKNHAAEPGSNKNQGPGAGPGGGQGGQGNGVFDVTVQFLEDTEEGRTPNRRVPSTHVMPDPDNRADGGADEDDGEGGY